MAETDQEIAACFPVMVQLRPRLVQERFVADVRRMQREGFRLAFLGDRSVSAVAGYRFMEMFSTGKILYVDDLVTDAGVRSRGYGEALMSWLLAEARRHECKYLELDSGVSRLDAHRFYRRNGLQELALHFSIPADGGPRWTSE
ncbi:GNAT family N-acetyltransferase [Sorangium sp. So ce448]|uniref:GNAT family N-acetyltransferase n=1 Tax=Sorangium sp. So ce448 TaxID=3133314 RepID=UPI003F62F80E